MKILLFTLIFIFFNFLNIVKGVNWDESFEFYSNGTFPSSWFKDGNASNTSYNYVTNTTSSDGSKSLKLYGTSGGCWAALIYKPLDVSSPFFIEIDIKNGNESLTGCHPERAGIGLRKGTSWTNPSRSFVQFDGDGFIYLAGSKSEAYITDTWYKIKVKYEKISSEQVKLSFWINNEFKGEQILPTKVDENFLTNLELNVQEGSAWFDNIKVYEYILNQNPTGTLQDSRDGHVYKTVKIGNQWWMAENLAATIFNDGKEIPLVTDSASWVNLTTPGYCWYNNDEETYKNLFGALYNWYTVETNNLCPEGWHVPNVDEWDVLTDFLGGVGIAGGKMKESGTDHWESPNLGATNESGFTSLPAGDRGAEFVAVNRYTAYLSSTENTYSIKIKVLRYDWEKCITANTSKEQGYSVRCIKDVTDLENIKITNISLNKTQFIKDNESIVSTITIKNKINKAISCNLKTSIKNDAYTYVFNTQNNISLYPFEEKRIQFAWWPTGDVKTGLYNFSAALTDPETDNEMSTKTFSLPIKIFDESVSIKLENFILNNPSIPNTHIIWTNDNNSPAKICADGSVSTIMTFYDENDDYNLSNIRFKLKSDPYNSNNDLYGKFQNYTIAGKNLIAEFQHPDYVPDLYKPFRPDTIIVTDNSNSNFVISEVPVQIYRAPVLMVHGLWGKPEKMGTICKYLLENDFFKNEQLLLANYKKTNDESLESNKAIVPLEINSLFEQLKDLNFSAGKVDIIAHSMGGLVVRKYLQGNAYRNDIHKIITLNTPHSGTQAANMLLNSGDLSIEAMNVREILTIFGHNLSNGAVTDLKVNSDEINNLSYSASLGNRKIPAHSIISSFNNINIPNGGFLEYYIDLRLYDIYGGDNFMKLYNGEPHDVIVPLSSQIGGLSNYTYFNNVTHQAIRENNDVFPVILDLLNQSSTDELYFTLNGYSPETLFYYPKDQLKSLFTKETCDKQIENSIEIINPENLDVFVVGETIPITVEASNDINHLVINLLNTEKIYSLDTLTTGGTFNFQIPQEVFDSLTILAYGYLDNCYIDKTSIVIYIENDSYLNHIEVYPQNVTVSENATYEILLKEYYQGGYSRELNIQNNEKIRYEIGDTSIANLLDNNVLSGKSIGYTTLNIFHSDTSLIVPIHVIPEDTSITNYIIDTTTTDTVTTNTNDSGINKTDDKFLVFPNPSKDQITLVIIKPENSILKIYSINGKELYAQSLNDYHKVFDINLNGLSKGVYFISIQDKISICTKKLIIQ